MKGDRFLFGLIATVPSLGGGMLAYTNGLETLGMVVGVPAALFGVVALALGGFAFLKLASRPLRALHGIANALRGSHG